MRFAAGESRHLQYAPYLDLRPLESSEPDVATILARPEAAWITRELEAKAQPHAIATIVPAHIADVRGRTIERIDKTEAAVKDRLTKEINYWDHRAEELRLQERAGRAPARLNSEEARKRANEDWYGEAAADGITSMSSRGISSMNLDASVDWYSPNTLRRAADVSTSRRCARVIPT